ncbi:MULTISPECIES: YggT family protein [Janibacter]|uniref:YggT family protein n=1 Tax=Janibacter indicus TaxID=857417 RepID=A0A1W2ADD5_9MICO|nr:MULTISPECIES: YggT family protein [Janibacter]QNF95289.1 YggT family protein [Janibacter sp. YB324]SMC58613.1 YggT family protein [Janibacter indicus]
MSIVRDVLHLVLYVYFLILIGRLVLDWIQVFARQWRPRGVILVVAEAIYTLTDPPLRAIRKVIKPVRIGGVALDLAFLVLIIVVSLLLRIV